MRWPALAAVVAWLAAPPVAFAAPPRSLERGISDGSALLTQTTPRLADLTLRRAARAGAEFARLPLQWYRVEAGPAPLDPADPADPAYDWTAFDALVRATAARALEPLVRIDSAPPRHEALERWRFASFGSWSPDSAAYGRFATAAARRYSGRFPDPLHPGAFLPRVRLWQAWNEPNLPLYLQPQWVVQDGRWVAWAPEHYRRMLNAFYAGVKGVDPRNVVATAGTAPNGEQRAGAGRMTPVRFWQELLCLGSGTVPAPVACPDPPHFDVFVHHPLTVTDPDVASHNPGDVTVADFYKLKGLLRLAQRTGRAPRHVELWVTEINWNAGAAGATSAQIERWVPRAFFRLWREGVSRVAWQFIRDPLDKLDHPGGLYALDPRSPFDPARDRPKRAVLRAFSFPFTGVRRDRRHVELWALAPQRRVAVQRLEHGRWVTWRHLDANASGLVHAVVALPGAGRLRLATARHGYSTRWTLTAR